MVHDHHIEICLLDCLRDLYLAQYYSPCTQHRNTTTPDTIARKYQLNFHLYADDTQLYTSFRTNNTELLPLIICNIQNCVIDIKSWMKASMLQLNIVETEVLVLLSKSLRNPITIIINIIKIDSIDISTASSVRNVGAICDKALSSEAFVNSICKSAWRSPGDFPKMNQPYAIKMYYHISICVSVHECVMILYNAYRLGLLHTALFFVNMNHLVSVHQFIINPNFAESNLFTENDALEQYLPMNRLYGICA